VGQPKRKDNEVKPTGGRPVEQVRLYIRDIGAQYAPAISRKHVGGGVDRRHRVRTCSYSTRPPAGATCPLQDVAPPDKPVKCLLRSSEVPALGIVTGAAVVTASAMAAITREGTRAGGCRDSQTESWRSGAEHVDGKRNDAEAPDPAGAPGLICSSGALALRLANCHLSLGRLARWWRRSQPLGQDASTRAEEVVFGHVARSKTDGGSALEPEAVHRMALSLGPVGEIAEISPLTGGLECETSAFTYGGQRFVVKLFKAGEHYPAVTEFENLSRVSRLNVPTPEPVSLDDSGVWFGAPAFVLTALPGRSGFASRDVRAWTSGAATALATIHEFAPDVAGAAVLTRWRRWQPTTEGLGSDLVRAENALGALYLVAADAPVVFSHDDYNPGNVLFCGGSLSGVVDWSDITVEPRQAAVALYRHMLAIHPGGRAPDLFLASYQTAADVRLDHMPL